MQAVASRRTPVVLRAGKRSRVGAKFLARRESHIATRIYATFSGQRRYKRILKSTRRQEIRTGKTSAKLPSRPDSQHMSDAMTPTRQMAATAEEPSSLHRTPSCSATKHTRRMCCTNGSGLLRSLPKGSPFRRSVATWTSSSCSNRRFSCVAAHVAACQQGNSHRNTLASLRSRQST